MQPSVFLLTAVTVLFAAVPAVAHGDDGVPSLDEIAANIEPFVDGQSKKLLQSNPTSFVHKVEAELRAGATPAWVKKLPAEYQAEIPAILAANSDATVKVTADATATDGQTVKVTKEATLKPTGTADATKKADKPTLSYYDTGKPKSEKGSKTTDKPTDTTTDTATAASNTAGSSSSSTSSSALGAKETAAYAAGAAGVLGFVGMLAL